jgi:hypothetical protein
VEAVRPKFSERTPDEWWYRAWQPTAGLKPNSLGYYPKFGWLDVAHGDFAIRFRVERNQRGDLMVAANAQVFYPAKPMRWLRRKLSEVYSALLSSDRYETRPIQPLEVMVLNMGSEWHREDSLGHADAADRSDEVAACG